MNTRTAAACCLVASLTVGLSGQQEPPPDQPVFRVQVDAVEIDVFVTDAEGNPVTDLTADDFELLEEGTPQAITSFSLVNIPIEREPRPLYSGTDLEPDVESNQGEGRLYVVALDEVRADLALRTRHFLRRFLEEHFAANDMGAVVYIGRGRRSDTQDFTSNRRLLLNAIDKFSGGFGQEASAAPPTGGLTDGQIPAPGALFASSPQEESLTRTRMRALRDLLEFMGTVRGRRKTLIYVTERLGTCRDAAGQECDINGVLDYNGGVRSIAFDDLHAAIAAATRGNVSIYPVDPAGLSPGGALGDVEAAPSVVPGEGLARIQALRTLADATGGFAVVNSNGFDEAFARIVRENSSYYVLGFTSTHTERDGRYRRIRVRVNRPGVQVRAREGYLAPKGRSREEERTPLVADVSPAVSEALASPIGASALPMHVFAAPYRGEDRNAAVAIAVHIDASSFALTEKDGTFTGRLEIVDAAVAADGKLFPGDRRYVDLTLRPDTYERARQNGLRMLLSKPLRPGRYQLRVAAGLSGGPTGAVVADLDVPDFSREPFSMSGVSLTSTSAPAVVSVPAPNPLEGLLPGPITTAREFESGETLALFAEIYEGRRNAPTHTVDIRAELRTDDGRVIATVTEERSSRELDGRPGGYGFVATMPLADADPGLYVIHVEARMNMGDRPTVSRDIPIRVVPRRR